MLHAGRAEPGEMLRRPPARLRTPVHQLKANARASALVGLATLLLATLCLQPAAAQAKDLAPTPYMGWQTYLGFGGKFNETTILEQASNLVTSGLEHDGYNIIWLDSGWWLGTRNKKGQITVSSTQWPHGLAWLTRTLHAWGFKVGIYTDAGPIGCSGTNRGSYGHYQQDVNTFAAWGFDAVKVDFCGGEDIHLNPQSAYTKFEDAILHNSSHRPMLLNICVYAQPGQVSSGYPSFAASAFSSYSWGYSVATSWRTDTDIGSPSTGVPWANVLRNLDADATEPLAAGPGHWNDPNYLGPDLGMTDAQFQTQFSMWAMLAAPLMISDNLSTLSPASLATVSNRQVIAIDQDRLGRQGTQVPPADVTVSPASGDGEVWLKPLEHGKFAIALLNIGSTPLTIATSTQALAIPGAPSYSLANVWAGGSSDTTGAISAAVPAYSTVVYVVSPKT
jgi:alpha-galactosidase